MLIRLALNFEDFDLLSANGSIIGFRRIKTLLKKALLT